MNGLAPTTSCLIAKALKYDLRHQIFTFNGNLYSQDNGISMGAHYSPGLANIYLMNFDREMINSPSVVFYRRYIDDIFVILHKSYTVPSAKLETLKLRFSDTQRGNVVPYSTWCSGITLKR
ncbi:hypothetical protein RF11_07021 [Thelohanellus kitauei]|uniref:Reverse transcriptase domain-containing protein n=1 Tax=Thelohanellus kitauei TaxID=669202 RepID=A0A0C2NEN8_THEKT|nr:hypothetical protein RF11_07021 [Thelohanellus kitauei]